MDSSEPLRLIGNKKDNGNSKKDSELSVVYLLAALGDLSYSILLTGCILYGTQLGGSQADSGLIGGAYGLTYLIMPAILGRLSDKFSRKVSLILSAVFQISISFFYISLGSSIGALIIGQALTGVAYGFFWPNIESIISEKTGKTPETHQKGIANFCIAWSVGFMVGPLISGVISDIEVTIVFIIAILIYGLMLVLIAFFITNNNNNQIKGDKKPIPVKIKKSSKSNLQSAQADQAKAEQVKENQVKEGLVKADKLVSIKILFGMSVYALIAKLVFTYFTDYAVRDDLLNWDGTLTGQVIFVFGIGRTIYFILSRIVNGGLFKSSLSRINNSFLIICGILLIMPLNDSPIVISGIFLFFGFFIGLIYLSSLDLLIVRERKAKGAKTGLFESMIGLGGVLSPFIAGILGQILAFLPFIVFSIVVFILFLVNLFVKVRDVPVPD